MVSTGDRRREEANGEGELPGRDEQRRAGGAARHRL